MIKNEPRTFQGSIDEVQQRESDLLSHHFHRSPSQDPEGLRPGEYIVSHFSGTLSGFEGPAGGTLIWLEP